MSTPGNSDPTGGPPATGQRGRVPRDTPDPAAAPAAAAPPAPLTPEPLPYDGVVSVAVGTALWAVASVIMLFFLDDLRHDGRLWWLATTICGFGLGLAGLWIVIRRRHRLRAEATGTS